MARHQRMQHWSHDAPDWYRPNQDLESKLESKFNMYERQIDHLFEFSYQSHNDIESLKDDIKTLFKMKDDNQLDNQYNEIKICIQNYYQLELENKRRMEYIDCYQFQLFIVIIVIIVYLICLRFSYV